MDKYEYRVRAEEINALIEKREYGEAVKIADTIDWRRVKSVTMLCKVSELYKMNRRYEDSRDILLLAYERQPGSRKIVYSLCELSIKLEELVLAIEYYKEFVQVAPRDTGRFILQYRLYEAQDVSLEERIAVLEEYKKRDYREKWAYELAYLYHRVGLATRCVEECDELILWFGEGKYVIKAMELKMLHVPLSPTQQEKYDKRFQSNANAYVVKTSQDSEQSGQQEADVSPKGDQPSVTTDTIPSMPIQIKSIDPSNLPTTRIPSKDISEGEVSEAEDEVYGQALTASDVTIDVPNIPVAQVPDDLDIHVKTIDMGQYNTINLQKELAENLAKVMEQEDMEASDATKSLPVDSIKSYADEIEQETITEPESLDEVYFDNDTQAVEEPISAFPSEEELLASLSVGETKEEESDTYVVEEAEQEEPDTYAVEEGIQQEEPDTYAAEETQPEEPEISAVEEEMSWEQEVAEVPVEDISEPVLEAEPIEEPVEEPVDEQITGQLSFADIMAEWEETKRANEAKHLEEMRRKVMAQTGPMFKNFDEEAKASVQADLDLIAPSLNVFKEQEAEEEPISELPSEEELLNSLFPKEEEPASELPSEEELLNSLFPKEEESVSEPEPPMEEEQQVPFQSLASYVGFEPVESAEPLEEIWHPQEFVSEETEETEETISDPVSDLPSEEELLRSLSLEEEPKAYSPVLNTAEIYGLEEKLISDAMNEAEKEPEEEPELEIPQIDDLLEEPAAEQMQESVLEEPIEELIAEPIPEPVSETELIEEPAAEPILEPVSEIELPEEPVPALSKPTGNTEEFDKSLESMVLEALAETEKSAEEPAPNPLTQDTGFIIADLTNAEENPQPTESVVLPEPEKKAMPVKRTLTRDEKELFGSIAQTKELQEEVANAIDNVSLNPCIGNVLVTGEKGTGTLTVAKNLVKVLSINDDNFSGKVAKISGELLNTKSMEETINSLADGALIVEQAGALDEMALLSLGEALKKKIDAGILVVLEDTKKAIDGLLAKTNMPKQFFDLRIDIAALDNDGLVNYGKEYANEKEYSIDAMGVLALYTRISEMQTNEHAVTVDEVRELVDEAIQNSERKNISHFMDILLAKRYDDEDMIVLREKDFLK